MQSRGRLRLTRDSMRKKLIFFIYIGDERTPQQRHDEGFVAKIHFYCLKKYRNVFDEAKFVLSVKPELIGNAKLISSYVEYIMSLGYYENTEFKVDENTFLRESKTLYEEILESDVNDNRFVFFGHLRGESVDSEDVARWVFSNYYYSMSREWEITYWLSENNKVFYGFPLTDCRQTEGRPVEVLPFNRFFFLGSTYWINVSLLKDVMKTRNMKKPRMIGRFFSENFPGNVASYELVSTAAYTACETGWDPYSQFDLMLEEWSYRSGLSLDEFNEEYEKAKSGV